MVVVLTCLLAALLSQIGAAPVERELWAETGALCTNTCDSGTVAGLCNDGGAGAEYSDCEIGTDCNVRSPSHPTTPCQRSNGFN